MKKRTKVWLSVPVGAMFAFFLMFGVTPAAQADSWTFVPIDVPGAAWTDARDTSPSGSVVGTYKGVSFPRTHGYLLTEEGFSDISVITHTALGLRVDVRGVNSRGDIVGSTSDPSKFLPDFIYHGFLLSGGNVTWIDVPAGQCPADMCRTYPMDINEKGDIVGFYVAYTAVNPPYPPRTYHSEHGFLWSHGVFTTLDATPLGATLTNLRGINPDGDIVGVYSEFGLAGPFRGFLRRYDGNFSSINVEDAVGTAANAINSAGQIVGDYETEDGIVHGYLLSEGTFTSFVHPEAGDRTYPFGINANGWIAGFYFDSSNVRHGFLVSRKGLE